MKKGTVIILIFPLLLSIFAQAQWSAPVNISPGTTTVGTNENAGQCIAVSGDTVRVVYVDFSNVPAKIMFTQSRDAGQTWLPSQVLQTSNGSSFPAVATYGSSIHVTWMDSIGASRASFYRRSLDGGNTWLPAVCLDSVTEFWPGIACFGNLVIATLNKDLAGNTEVFIVRSVDNGTSWLPEQQISHAVNRSEDPAINILGKDVHLSWNDKRSGTMNIYYCHSADSGATWGPETALTNVDSYTSMVCLNNNFVDVPHAIRASNFFDVWLAESSDTGNTFVPNLQLTNTTASAELYPFMARDGMNLHIVYTGSGGSYYIHSADGGISWDAPFLLGGSGQAFIAYTGCTLHVIYAVSGNLWYRANPTGNCILSSAETPDRSSFADVSPNPISDEKHLLHISSPKRLSGVRIFNTTGEQVLGKFYPEPAYDLFIDLCGLPAGIYFYEVKDDSGEKTNGKLLKQ